MVQFALFWVYFDFYVDAYANFGHNFNRLFFTFYPTKKRKCLCRIVNFVGLIVKFAVKKLLHDWNYWINGGECHVI